MGIVSLAVEYNSIILLGIDTHCCKGHQQINDLLTAHIRKLRKQFPDGWIIHIPEANLGHEADHMEYMLRSYRKIYTLRDKQRTGVVTTANRKELYAIEAQKYIIQESIHIHEGFFSSNPHGTAKEEERVLEEFKKQLLGFKRIIVAPQRGYSLPKVVVSKPSSFPPFLPSSLALAFS